MNARRILVVEDELLTAMNLEDLLEEFGFEVVGPCPTLDEARDAVRDRAPDGAVLDVNLRGEMVFPLALELAGRKVPIVFCTGYAEAGRFPPELASLPRVAKPYTAETMRSVLSAAFAA